jgi:hypothetical protein
MTAHALATVLIPFDAENAGLVDTAITAWDAGVGDRLNGTGIIHFASASTVTVSADKAYLIIELSADAPADEALRIFASLLKPELAALLVAAGILVPAHFERWFISKSVRIGQSPFVRCGLLFDGSPAMSVRRILTEDQLAATIEASGWLQSADAPAQKLGLIRERLWQACEGASNFKPVFLPRPAPILDPAPADENLFDRLRINAVIAYHALIWPLPLLPMLFLLFALPPRHGGWWAHVIWPLLEAGLVIIAAAAALAIAVRRRETRDKVTLPRQTRANAEAILARENATSQNILATISVLKPGLTRRLTLQLVFYAIRTVLPLYWAPGRLGDLNDIHFMRWLLLPGSNLLVFRSHYDGSWVNYIEDFALRAPQGVSAIWSNTKDFPPTRWLIFGGAADGPRFREWVHTQTRPVPFTYSAYPNLSMERIRLNARIARAVATGRLDEPVKGWLASLGDADGGDF